MHEMKELRVLLIKEGAWWTAVGLDINVCIQAQRINEVEPKFKEAIAGTIEVMKSEGMGCESLYQAAPDRYFKMWETAIPIQLHIDATIEKLLGGCGKPVGETRLFEAVGV